MAIRVGTGQAAQTTTERARRGQPSLDYLLILAVAGLLIVGLIAVYSATFDWSYQVYHNSFYIASRQFVWVGLGLVLLVGVAAIPYHRWRQVAVPGLGVALALLILVLLFGEERFGARRSFFNGSVHPSELAMLAMVIYVAAWLTSKGDRIRDVTYGLIPFAVLIGVIAALIVIQPDVSAAALIVLTALAMFFFAGADVFQLGIGGLASGGTFYVLINQLPHAKRRLTEYLIAWRDPLHASYHIRQALIALGSGGLFGLGLGQGQQKLGYLPASHTDSIFAVLGEELGFVGCLLVIALFALVAYRGFKIALNAPDAFAALLACGVTCWLTFQALFNLAVITGLLPFAGVALPFISSGGSAMVTSLVGVGLLLSVSRGRPVGKRVEKQIAKRGSFQHANLDRRWGNRGARLSRSRRHTSARR